MNRLSLLKKRDCFRRLAFFYFLSLSPIPVVAADSLSSAWWGRSFDSTSIGILSAGVLATAVSAPWDENFRENWKDHQKMSPSAARLGDFGGSGAPGVVIGLVLLHYDPPHGQALLKSLAAVSLWTSALKVAVGRRRPDSDERNSWPSGHTSVSFATATALGMAYGWRVGVPAGLLASAIGASRMADDRHWLSDVVAGAAVGIWMGYAYAESPASAELTSSSPSTRSVSRVRVFYPSVENETLFFNFVASY